MDNRRLLLAFLLSAAVLFGWQLLFPPPEELPSPPSAETVEAPEPAAPPARAADAPPSTVPSAEEAEPAPAEEIEEITALAEERVVVETPDYRAELSNRGAQLLSFRLAEHRNADGGPVDLVRAREDFPYPFAVVSRAGDPLPLDDALFAVERTRGPRDEEVVEFRYGGPAGTASKRFTFHPDGLVDVEVRAPGGSDWGLLLGPGIRNPTVEEIGGRFAGRSMVYRLGDDTERTDPQKVEPGDVPAGGLRWIGLQDTYFLAAAVPAKGLASVRVRPVLLEPEPVDGRWRFHLVSGQETEAEIEARKEWIREILLVLVPERDELAVAAYLGAKQYDRLAALPYGLEETVDLGFFRILSRPLLWGLRWTYENVVTNYGWAIVLMTVVIRLLLFPLTHKSVVSMQKMQQVNPKVQAIRQKYRGKLKDKQGKPNVEAQRKMNEEVMALYRSEGVNPAGGCLPMLLQLPVFFAFYTLLSAAIELRHAPWLLWIQDLSAPDPYYVLPIVMGASQFAQQKMTPAAGDPMQRKIMGLMPIFFTVLFLGFPSGLVLYWLTSNVLGIAQQVAYQRWRERHDENAGESVPAKTKKARS